MKGMTSITRIKGKGSKEELLPHRTAMTQLTKGDPVQRSMNNYAKLTPSGESALMGDPSMYGPGPMTGSMPGPSGF